MNPSAYGSDEKGSPSAPSPTSLTGPPPPPVGFVMPQPQGTSEQQQTVVITSQPGSQPVVLGPALPPTSTRYKCPSCHEDITTNVEYKNSGKTHGFAILLCIFGCWCCAPIPYCRESCKDAHHYCPHCAAYIGKSQ